MTDPLVIKVTPEKLTEDKVKDLRRLLLTHPGHIPVYIQVNSSYVNLKVGVDAQPELLDKLLRWQP